MSRKSDDALLADGPGDSPLTRVGGVGSAMTGGVGVSKDTACVGECEERHERCARDRDAELAVLEGEGGERDI